MQRANRSLSRNACGQKGRECAPEFPASLYVLCPRLPGENPRKAPGDAGCRGICGRTRHTCSGLTLSPSPALGFFRVQCDALRSGDLVDSEGSAPRKSLTGKGQRFPMSPVAGRRPQGNSAGRMLLWQSDLRVSAVLGTRWGSLVLSER